MDDYDDYALLDVPTSIVTVGNNNELRGTATGILYGTIVDHTGKKHRVRFPSLIALGLGANVLSSLVMTWGITPSSRKVTRKHGRVRSWCRCSDGNRTCVWFQS